MTYTTGLTVFNTAPGEKEEMHCNVCDSRCEVKRKEGTIRIYNKNYLRALLILEGFFA